MKSSFGGASRQRLLPENFELKEDYLIYLRTLFAHEFAKEKIPQNCLVLDVGSGEGFGTNLLSKSKKVRKIIGLDVDIDAVKHASKKYGSNKCIFKHYDGNKIPFENNFFDAVISVSVIEHIQDDKNYVSEIYRVLRNGGVFIIFTPNRIHRLKSGQKPWLRFHVREYDSETLKEVLQYRFNDIEILGIRGNKEVQRIEMERLRKIKKMFAFDKFNLGRKLPECIDVFIIKLIKKLIFKKTDIDFISKFSVNDFYITKKQEEALDCLVVCKK